MQQEQAHQLYPKLDQEIYLRKDRIEITDHTCNFPYDEIVNAMEKRGITMIREGYAYCG